MSFQSLSPAIIERQTFVNSVELLSEVDSTNSYALRTLNRQRGLPHLIIAERQSHGRGRGTNQWWGAAGSLTFSLVFAPGTFNIQLSQWPVMSLIVALAIKEGLQPFLKNDQIQLKWPNDIYVDGKKIGGILIETASSHRDLVVLGIGLNINNPLSSAPEEVQQRATSLIDLNRTPETFEALLISLLQSFGQVFQQFGAICRNLKSEWEPTCFLSGKQIIVDESQRSTSGTCLGIGDDGALQVKTPTGLQSFFAGTITVVEESAP